MSSIKERGVPTEIVQKENVINNPSQELLKRAILDILVRSNYAKIKFHKHYDGGEIFPQIEDVYKFDYSEGKFGLDTRKVEGPKETITESLINSKHTTFITYEYYGDGLKELKKNIEESEFFGNSYKIFSFDIRLSNKELTEGGGYLSGPTLSFRGEGLILNIKKDDENLLKTQCEYFRSWFRNLDKSQQK